MSASTTIARLREVLADDTFAARYEVLGEAGRGGMGTLHRANERGSARPVAIKVLHEPAHADRFTREAELLERLSHPAIVSYLGHGVTSDGSAYLAMAWLDGEDLAHRLDRGALSVPEAIAVGVRLAEALAHAHDLGIVHRDIKPSNVLLVDEEPRLATLLDFGIAKDTTRGEPLTATGQLVGTPGYMAPEQALGARDVDFRVDLFGLGALLYHALAGEPPFAGRQTMEVLARVLMTDAPPLRELCPEVPPRLADLIRRLLAREPAERPATATAVAVELHAIGEAIAAGDRASLDARSPVTAITRVDRPVAPAPRSRRRTVALVVGGLALAVAVTLAIAMNGGDATDTPAVDARAADAPTVSDAPSSSHHPCVAEGRCAARCEAGDVQACSEQGLLAAKAPLRDRIPWFSRACELGDASSCMHAGNLMRRALARGDRSFTRDGWVAALERGCALGAGTVCSVLAGYLADERPTDVDPVIALLLRGCRSPRASVTSCTRGAEMLDLRGRPGDREEAVAVRAIACRAGYSPACSN